MADESDVEAALVKYLYGTLYPAGDVASAPARGCITGAFTKLYRGYPLSPQLDKDLKAGVVNVSVFARNGVERITTRYFRDWYQLTPPVHTLAVAVSGPTVTVGGTVSTPQNVAVRVGNAPVFSYAVQATDTLASIAAALAAGLTAQGVSAAASGAVLTVASSARLVARVGGFGTVARELKRQDKSFQITIWAGSTEARDAAAKVLDPALALLNFIALPDGSKGLVRYERTVSMDTGERMSEYRRDLFYWVEFPTIQTMQAPEVINFNVAVAPPVAGAGPTFSRNY